MELTISIGPETDDCCVTVTISDDAGWSPDQVTDYCNRAVTAAVTSWQLLHASTT